MKPFFRFLTSEINGFLLSSFNHFLNVYITYLYPVLSYFNLVQFKSPDEPAVDGELNMTAEDIDGIGKIAGVFQPYISAESNLGSLVFTNNVLYTERGLFNMDDEKFDIVRTAQEDYPDDITTLATDRLRASWIPTGQPILGWIPYGVDVLDEDGNIIWASILPAVPEPPGYAYPYYGEEYLFLAETFFKFAYLDVDTYKQYIESQQRIRYNGVNVAELCTITEILTEDYVKIHSFGLFGTARILFYSLNETSPLPEKNKRLFIWLQLLQDKFKQIIPVEVT